MTVTASLQAEFALELAHGYLRPIDVDTEVGLLAVIGEGMQGTPGLAGRIFTAISREKVNIIAIAQGSSELTIGTVVARSGLCKPFMPSAGLISSRRDEHGNSRKPRIEIWLPNSLSKT